MGLPLDDPGRRRLPPLLRASWYRLNQAFRRRIAHLNLTPNQFTILRWLQEAEDETWTQKRLVGVMSSDANTVAALVERMSAEGLIRRRVDPDDRRARRLRITAKGRRLYAKARPIALELQEEVLGAIPGPQRETFLAQLEAVAHACRQAQQEPCKT